MSIINLLCLLIVSVFVLIGFIIGFKQKSIVGFSFLIGFIFAFFLVNPLSNLIMRSPLGSDYLTEAYLRNLSEDEVLLAIISGDDITTKTNKLSLGLDFLKIPVLFQGFFISNVFISDSSVRIALASSFAYLTIKGILTLLFFILVFVLIRKLLKKITTSFFGEKGNNIAGRIYGGLKGFAFASIIITGLMFIIVLINQIMIRNANLSFNNYLDEQLSLSDGKKYSLGKIYYIIASSLLNWISLI